MEALKRFWYGLLEFFLDRCQCGGRYLAWDEKRAYCDGCGRKQFAWEP